MLKICTDTYKIIDKNIPLLSIRLGESGQPHRRLGLFLGLSMGRREDGEEVEKKKEGVEEKKRGR